MEKRNHSIDIIKAICAIFIIITHLLSNNESRSLYTRFWIDLAVPFFLIITGYNYKNSCEKKKITSFLKWFSWSNIKSKLSRILMPYFIAVIIYILFSLLTGRFNFSAFIEAFKYFQLGPGCYYIAILLQILVLFPILYFGQKKFGIFFTIIALLLQLRFEYMANLWWMNESMYQLLSIRYIVFLIAGINLDFIHKYVHKNILIITFIIGCLYIYIYNYSGYEPMLFRLWIHSSMPTVLYCVPIILLSFSMNKHIHEGYILKIFTTIGKASYHIFLTQMVYFYIGITYNLLRDIPLCIIVGVLFYYTESYGYRYVKNKLRSFSHG